MMLTLRKEWGSSGLQVEALMGHLLGARPEKTSALLKSTLSSYAHGRLEDPVDFKYKNQFPAFL